jgi:hypothetical protein
LEADVGIEPTYPALQAGALPFCYSADKTVSLFERAASLDFRKLVVDEGNDAFPSCSAADDGREKSWLRNSYRAREKARAR